jgi:hypothetical protein
MFDAVGDEDSRTRGYLLEFISRRWAMSTSIIG